MISKYVLFKISLNKPELICWFFFFCFFVFLHTAKLIQVLLRITNNSVKHQSFVNTQLYDQTVLFLKIQFSKSQQS